MTRWVFPAPSARGGSRPRSSCSPSCSAPAAAAPQRRVPSPVRHPRTPRTTRRWRPSPDREDPPESHPHPSPAPRQASRPSTRGPRRKPPARLGPQRRPGPLPRAGKRRRLPAPPPVPTLPSVPTPRGPTTPLTVRILPSPSEVSPPVPGAVRRLRPRPAIQPFRRSNGLGSLMGKWPASHPMGPSPSRAASRRPPTAGSWPCLPWTTPRR